MMRHFITRRVAISMLFIGLTMLGYISYRFLPVELLPEVEPPTLIIAVSSAREVDPTQLEREAILPLEEAAGLLAGIQEIESFANRQSGTIRLSFRNTVDIKYAYLRLQERVQAVIPNIPVTYNVTVEKVLQGDLNQIFLTLQVRGEGDVDALRNLAELKIVPELEAIDGIASVILAGGRQRSVEIILDDDAADAYNLTASRLRGLLGNNNQDKTFVGRVRHYQKSYFVNVSAEYQAVSDIGQLVVDPVGPVLLRDIAEIRDGFKEETEISRVNGKSSVTIQLFKDSQANLLHLGDLTHPVLARLNRNLASEEVEIAVQQDPSEILRDNMDLLVNLSLTGALAAMVVLWFFLRHLPLVVMIGVALPISIFTAFNIFYGFGITLNALTMVGLALAVGMLLDNSVVVLENIYRLAQQGLKPLEAALQGTREVWRSILATTLTTVSVFLPFSFAQEFGIKVLGEQVGISIIGTLLVSLLVALLLIPMGAYALLTWRPDVPRQFRISSKRSPAVHRYTVILKAAMRYPILVIIASLLIFFLSLVLVLTANSQGATESLDRNLTLYLTMGSGATLESTDRAMVELEKALEGIDEVESFVSQVYAEEGVVTLNLKENFEDLADRDAGAVKSDINRRIAEFRMGDVSFDQPATGGRFSGMGGRATQNFQAMLGTATNPERVVLKGQDLAVMNALADDIANQLEDLNEIRFARVNTARSRPELHLNFNQVLLSRYNVPYGNIIGELNSFQPEVSTGISYRDGTEDIDITLRNPLPDPEDKQRTVPELRRLTIPASNGDFYQLEALSDFVFTEGEGGVRRFNQERQVELTYRFEDEINASSTLLEEARASVEDLVNQFNIPEGIAVEVIHEENDASDFYMLGILAFVLVFLILASVFESLVNPWVILFTIPLAAIGTFIALLVTGEPLLSNYTVYVGMLILLGIIVNNGIILIDYARQLRQRGFRIQRALLVAGQARLRPILITAITTIVGMLPLAMGKAESITQIAAPFAITVIGGLGFGTLLTLILIPTVYMGLEDLLRWLRNLPLSTRLTQLILLLAGFAYIYFEVDSLYWQSVDLLVLLTLLPAATYFIRSSLRRTSTRLIPADTPLRIRLHYLYKLYGRPPRFRREWQRTPRLPAWTSR